MRASRMPAIALLFLSAAAASAQGGLPPDPILDRSLDPAPRVVTGRELRRQDRPQVPNAAWGSQLGAIHIGATKFTGRFNPASPNLDYEQFQFYSGLGEYYAQVTVDPGNAITHFSCHFNDSHATDNIQFRWLRFRTDFDSGTSSGTVLDSFVSSGTPGVASGFLDPGGEETMHIYDPIQDDLIQHYLSVTVTPNVSFAGCYAFFRRQVAPSPATATFSDVPTSHPFFRFVEALASTGVTAGCGGGLYCVNAAVTRGELAVFLAVALGMGIPY